MSDKLRNACRKPEDKDDIKSIGQRQCVLQGNQVADPKISAKEAEANGVVGAQPNGSCQHRPGRPADGS